MDYDTMNRELKENAMNYMVTKMIGDVTRATTYHPRIWLSDLARATMLGYAAGVADALGNESDALNELAQLLNEIKERQP